jgi:HK97 family phage major capsid protein
MDMNELIESRKLKVKELEDILDKVKLESREMFTSENDDFNKINSEIEKIDKELEEKKKVSNKKINIKENRTMEKNKFSLLSAIRDYTEGRGTSDTSAQMFELGKAEMNKAGISPRGQIILPWETRAIVNATTAGEGEYNIAEIKYDMLGALRNELVAVRAGATLLSGLNGTISIPIYAGSTSAWKAENTTAVDGAGAFTEVTLSAKRITSILDISKQWLNQDSNGAEQLLMQDLTASVLGILESTIFGTASGSTVQPAGILYNVSYTSTGTTTWANIVALESAVETSNALAGKLAYITTPSLKGVFKTTAKASNAAVFVAEGNNVNGYPLFSTSAMTSGKCVFGNFSDLLIGNWGGVDILVDPYTQGHLGVVRLVVNSYWDFVKRRSASFVYGNLT